jgi:hypothetical protein
MIRYVETLRAAAAQLDGSGLPMSPEDRGVLRVTLAAELRALAFQLCDHPRVRDGVCLCCDCPIEMEATQ